MTLKNCPSLQILAKNLLVYPLCAIDPIRLKCDVLSDFSENVYKKQKIPCLILKRSASSVENLIKSMYIDEDAASKQLCTRYYIVINRFKSASFCIRIFTFFALD